MRPKEPEYGAVSILDMMKVMTKGELLAEEEHSYAINSHRWLESEQRGIRFKYLTPSEYVQTLKKRQRQYRLGVHPV